MLNGGGYFVTASIVFRLFQLMSSLATFDLSTPGFSCPQKMSIKYFYCPSEVTLILGAEYISKSLITVLV